MKIAIDINDVVRDFSQNFVRYYLEGYDHEFNLDEFEFWTNHMDELFPFKSERDYHEFIYNNFAFELFAKCDVKERGIDAKLNTWLQDIVMDIDADEPIEVMFVSPMEYGNSIGYTYFFLSKLGTKIREVFMPINSAEIWNRCDVLITANPDLLALKPENKTSIKIKAEYNNDSAADFTYTNLSSFLSEKNNTEILIKSHE